MSDDDYGKVRRFWKKATRRVPAKLHDPHIDDDAITGVAAAVNGDIASRLGYDDLAFVAAVWSGTVVWGRDYIFGKPAGRSRAGGRWMATVLSTAERRARRGLLSVDRVVMDGMVAAVHRDIVNRLGHDDFAFILAVHSVAGGHDRYYVFSKPAGVEEAQYAGWPADMLARAARMARRETRP